MPSSVPGLISREDPQAAYDLLAPQQSERAGDPDYDYLLGLTALELGRNGAEAEQLDGQ